jgi:hypothetical protein
LTIFVLFLIYSNVKHKSEEFVTNSITVKFAEPQISQTLNDVAENQAQKIIRKTLNPSIQKATTSINHKIESFDKDLQEFKKEYDSELRTLSKEVEYLKNRNIVLKLGDKSIATGNSTSFEELENIYNKSTDHDIKMVALSEALRIKNHFATMTRIKGVSISYTHGATQKKFIEKNIPTEALIIQLKKDKKWQSRARIAVLLKDRKEKQVPDALLDAIKNDKKLEVRKEALRSFEAITGFTSRDVFKNNPATEWWVIFKKDIEKDLKELQTIEEAIKKNTQN